MFVQQANSEGSIFIEEDNVSKKYLICEAQLTSRAPGVINREP